MRTPASLPLFFTLSFCLSPRPPSFFPISSRAPPRRCNVLLIAFPSVPASAPIDQVFILHASIPLLALISSSFCPSPRSLPYLTFSIRSSHLSAASFSFSSRLSALTFCLLFLYSRPSSPEPRSVHFWLLLYFPFLRLNILATHSVLLLHCTLHRKELHCLLLHLFLFFSLNFPPSCLWFSANFFARSLSSSFSQPSRLSPFPPALTYDDCHWPSASLFLVLLFSQSTSTSSHHFSHLFAAFYSRHGPSQSRIKKNTSSVVSGECSAFSHQRTRIGVFDKVFLKNPRTD